MAELTAGWPLVVPSALTTYLCAPAQLAGSGVEVGLGIDARPVVLRDDHPDPVACLKGPQLLQGFRLFEPSFGKADEGLKECAGEAVDADVLVKGRCLALLPVGYGRP